MAISSRFRRYVTWKRLIARHQISTQLIEIECPHITLFTSQFADLSKLETLIKTFASKQEHVHLNFSSIGCLPGPRDSNVLFLSPTPTFALLQLHSQLCDLLRKEGVEIGDEFRVEEGRSLPHTSHSDVCSVAQEMPKHRVAEAFGVLKDLKLPVSGYAMDIGLVEFSPVSYWPESEH